MDKIRKAELLLGIKRTPGRPLDLRIAIDAPQGGYELSIARAARYVLGAIGDCANSIGAACKRAQVRESMNSTPI